GQALADGLDAVEQRLDEARSKALVADQIIVFIAVPVEARKRDWSQFEVPLAVLIVTEAKAKGF
ncbi:hypothetical protein ACPV47_25215, partial [Vibrio jasicida]|uniref:hypothetical protein n=1 Tax=Vibrio jasicida TaxID=766224 RepID=UPI0040676B3F